VIEAECSIWLNIEKVAICGRADDGVVADAEGSRSHRHALCRNRLGILHKPGASCAAAAQIAEDGGERENSGAGNLLADCNRAGSHGADSEHPVTLCHSLRRSCSSVLEKHVQSRPAGDPAPLIVDLIDACYAYYAWSGDPGPEFNPSGRDRCDLQKSPFDGAGEGNRNRRDRTSFRHGRDRQARIERSINRARRRRETLDP